MNSQTHTKYDIRINDRQRALIASALLTYIVEGGFQNTATEAELEEANYLQGILSNSDGDLTPDGINDLRP